MWVWGLTSIKLVEPLSPPFWLLLSSLACPIWLNLTPWDHFLECRIHTLSSLVGCLLPTSPQCPPRLALIWGCRHKGNTGHTWNSPLRSISFCFLLVLANDDRVGRRWERGQRSKDWETHVPDSVGKLFFLTTFLMLLTWMEALRCHGFPKQQGRARGLHSVAQVTWLPSWWSTQQDSWLPSPAQSEVLFQWSLLNVDKAIDSQVQNTFPSL